MACLRFRGRMSEQTFSGRNILVTGGSRGIGRAAALRLAGEGANVAMNYVLRRDEAESAAAEIKALGVKSAVLQMVISMKMPVWMFWILYKLWVTFWVI